MEMVKEMAVKQRHLEEADQDISPEIVSTNRELQVQDANFK